MLFSDRVRNHWCTMLELISISRLWWTKLQMFFFCLFVCLFISYGFVYFICLISWRFCLIWICHIWICLTSLCLFIVSWMCHTYFTVLIRMLSFCDRVRVVVLIIYKLESRFYCMCLFTLTDFHKTVFCHCKICCILYLRYNLIHCVFFSQL